MINKFRPIAPQHGKYYKTFGGIIVGPMTAYHDGSAVGPIVFIPANYKMTVLEALFAFDAKIPFEKDGKYSWAKDHDYHQSFLQYEVIEFNPKTGEYVVSVWVHIPRQLDAKQLHPQTWSSILEGGPVTAKTVFGTYQDKIDEPVFPPRQDMDGWDIDRFRSAIAAMDNN